MDGEQFDGLLWQLTSARSRRGALLGLLGGGWGCSRGDRDRSQET
jgi:hypothetical protein